MNSVPREVNGKWYPVPCPEAASLTLGFPTEEACASFCEAIEPVMDAHEQELERQADRHCDELNAAEDQSYDNGHDAGYEEGYNVGHDEGYDKGVEDTMARLTESA